MSNFQERIYKLVKKIPRGKVTTYKLIALKLGNKNLARAVGNALNKNQNLAVISCHRVIKSNGECGGYKLGLARKIKSLKNEGIIMKKGKIISLTKYLYNF